MVYLYVNLGNLNTVIGALPHYGGIAFNGFCDDASNGLIAHRKLPMLFGLFKAVAVWSRETPISGLHTRLHRLKGLAAHLQTFEFALCCEDGFSELILWCFAELIVQALYLCAPSAETRPSSCVQEAAVASR